MLIKKVDKNAAFNRANERRQKAHDLLLKMYEDFMCTKMIIQEQISVCY